MDNWEKLSKEADYYKKRYPIGSRIVLLSMGDDPHPIEPNTRGFVRAVDDIGTVHCVFDNGRSLGLVPGEDTFRLLTEKELADERLNDKAAFLEDFFWAIQITMSVDVVDGQIVANDDEGNKWVSAEVYDFALNECLCFGTDGSLSDGLAAAEPFVERLKLDAEEFGVKITSYVKSVDELIGEATDRNHGKNSASIVKDAYDL